MNYSIKIKEVTPDQIITLNDFPVHSPQCLKIYFRIFQTRQHKIVPPCPVLNKSTGIPFVEGKGIKIEKYNTALSNFLKQHSKAEYFLLDGTHRTTAATLSHSKIPVMIFETNKDIKNAKKLVELGRLFSLTTGDSIEKVIKILEAHFFKTGIFQTVAEKTKRMVKEKAIPKYMIDFYNKKT